MKGSRQRDAKKGSRIRAAGGCLSGAIDDGRTGQAARSRCVQIGLAAITHDAVTVAPTRRAGAHHAGAGVTARRIDHGQQRAVGRNIKGAHYELKDG